MSRQPSGSLRANVPRGSLRPSMRNGFSPSSLEPTASRPMTPDNIPDAISQLLRNNETEHSRYAAERAVRALKESDEEKPASAELRRLSRQAGELGRWRRRRRPALLKMVAAPRDPELPDELQAPTPPYSRWILDARANVLFNVFTAATNPVEDFYLVPMDDVWRTHRYGVYGLQYDTYPNAGTIGPPHDGSGLYYRPHKKVLADPDSARRARKQGAVVTLARVKTVAAKAVGQFYPKVFKNPNLFESWPHIDDVLGAVIEYFYHYFELRRVEETVVQLQCQLLNTRLTDERRNRMAECEAECGTIYSTYLLGFNMPFHHLKQGREYRSASASDREIFEAFLAFVAQCVWIVYRRPNVTVISREMGRLFRTPGFDPACRSPPTNLDPIIPAGTGTKAAPKTASPTKKKSAATAGSSQKTRSRNSGVSPPASAAKRAAGTKASPSPGSVPASGVRQQGAVAGAARSGRQASQGAKRTASSSSTQRSGGTAPSVADTQAAAQKTATPETDATPPSASAPTPSTAAPTPSTGAPTPSTAEPASDGSAAKPSSGAPTPSSDTQPKTPESTATASGPNTPGASPTADAAASTPPSPDAAERSPSADADGAEDSAAGDDTSISLSSSSPDQGSGRDQVHVSMKKVYGLYTGPPPPHCAVFALINNTTPLLRGSLARRPPAQAGSLVCDRTKLGILGTPLHHYDDVLSAIDYEREEKEARLQFMGPSSTKAGLSRVSGVIPYLTLPSKFLSPDS